MRSKTAATAAAVKANPATSAGTIGLVVVLLGAQLGWSPTTEAQVAAAFLAAVPVVRGVVAWWESRHQPASS
jgi:hypothetical protein